VVSPHWSAIPRLIIRRNQVILQAIVPLSSVFFLVQFHGQAGYTSNFFFSLLLDLLGGLLREFFSVPHHVDFSVALTV
jgi:hypothetical protein